MKQVKSVAKEVTVKDVPAKPTAIAIPLKLLPTDLQSVTPQYLAHLIAIGHKLITIKGDIDTKNPKGSAVIGQLGEEAVCKIYEKNYAIENVTKQGRTGDILIRRKYTDETHPHRQAILVEIKNYATAIGTSEVEKFYRDLSSNASICGGIFISLNTKIATISSNLHFTTRGDTPVVFLSLDWASDSNSVIEELINLTANIIWAHVDAKFIVDQDVFQKLSSKLTKLSDAMNGLSLNRTYITETRQIIDKQLTKIYETSYETEIGMRTLIASISKTLARGTEKVGGDDLPETSASFTVCTLDTFAHKFSAMVSDEFYTSLYNTDAEHQTLVNLAIETILNRQIDGNSQIALRPSKKSIFLSSVSNASKNSKGASKSDSKSAKGTKGEMKKMEIVFLKSRTDIQLDADVKDIYCPSWASCAHGIITFPIDSVSLHRETIKEINDSLEQMSL